MSTYFCTFQIVRRDRMGFEASSEVLLVGRIFETDVPEDTRAWIRAAEEDFNKSQASRQEPGGPIVWWRKLKD